MKTYSQGGENWPIHTRPQDIPFSLKFAALLISKVTAS